ncbi:peptidoglycan-binding domain-containing protein [Anabaena sp. CS-542/02]|uniref:peptidoglycan-binding domain-containing protein n=1 Tax=Anabaena sp. CS-542/02 TaxID=3021719 RepID=UPI00232CC21D|nr:peptidoglycan-binding protein [Anabaena sp. CS-542/02]MDB9447376.1 peptidoglycan-binding protein [Anabaena sp. CS-542/02]
MDNLAYLYLANTYENSASSELASLSVLFKKASAPDWKRLSGGAWKHLLPLAVAVSILSSISSAFALQRGDQGPSVANLQRQLQQAGFYREQITQVYDFSTEDAVRRFQASQSLVVDGVLGVETRQKLETLLRQAVNPQASAPTITSTVVPTINSHVESIPSLTTASTPFETVKTSTPQPKKVTTAKSPTQRRHPQLLHRGDQGEDVRVLQERLRVAGFYSGKATGVFGPVTEEAVKQFQTASKLDADGIVGPSTIKKLPPVGVGGGTTPPPRPRQTANPENLRMGNRGEAVRLLQQHLIAAGYLNATPSGYFGPHTDDAVRRFQAANHLAVSGIAGPTTRAKLYSLINTGRQGNFSVLEIQRRLQEQGFYRGDLNGVMSDETKRALQQAKTFYGINLSNITSGNL